MNMSAARAIDSFEVVYALTTFPMCLVRGLVHVHRVLASDQPAELVWHGLPGRELWIADLDTTMMTLCSYTSFCNIFIGMMGFPEYGNFALMLIQVNQCPLFCVHFRAVCQDCLCAYFCAHPESITLMGAQMLAKDVRIFLVIYSIFLFGFSVGYPQSPPRPHGLEFALPSFLPICLRNNFDGNDAAHITAHTLRFWEAPRRHRVLPRILPGVFQGSPTAGQSRPEALGRPLDRPWKLFPRQRRFDQPLDRWVLAPPPSSVPASVNLRFFSGCPGR